MQEQLYEVEEEEEEEEEVEAELSQIEQESPTELSDLVFQIRADKHISQSNQRNSNDAESDNFVLKDGRAGIREYLKAMSKFPLLDAEQEQVLQEKLKSMELVRRMERNSFFQILG